MTLHYAAGKTSLTGLTGAELLTLSEQNDNLAVGRQ